MGINFINGKEVITADKISINNGAPFFATVAASDAPEEIKATADYVCEGKDDQIVINEALSKSDGVLLSIGNFFISSPIIVNRKSLTGPENGYTTIWWQTTPSSTNEDKMIIINGSYSTLKNFSLIGHSQGDDENTVDGVDVLVYVTNSADIITIENCRLSIAKSYLIKFDESFFTYSTVNIRKCMFFVTGKTGAGLTSSGDGVLNFNNVFYLKFDSNLIQAKNNTVISGGIMFLGSSNNYLITNNIFIMIGTASFDSFIRILGSKTNGIASDVSDTLEILISNNTFEIKGTAPLKKAIHISSAQNICVNSNIFHCNGIPADYIYIRTCSNISVTGNTISRGIPSQTGAFISIINCDIAAVTGNNIYAALAATSTDANGNTITDIRGILVWSSTNSIITYNVTVTGNVIHMGHIAGSYNVSGVYYGYVGNLVLSSNIINVGSDTQINGDVNSTGVVTTGNSP